jgi:hypothetical protein
MNTLNVLFEVYRGFILVIQVRFTKVRFSQGFWFLFLPDVCAVCSCIPFLQIRVFHCVQILFGGKQTNSCQEQGLELGQV